MNRTGKTNAKKGPKVDFNAYKDFHDREIEAHIIWQSKEDKKAWLFNQIV